MLTHKDFYVWLDGFMTNRDFTTIRQIDIEIIKEKMKEVRDELDIDLSSIRINKRISPFNPVTMPFGDKDDLGHPPKIVM
jgi:hypothetical protein